MFIKYNEKEQFYTVYKAASDKSVIPRKFKDFATYEQAEEFMKKMEIEFAPLKKNYPCYEIICVCGNSFAFTPDENEPRTIPDCWKCRAIKRGKEKKMRYAKK